MPTLVNLPGRVPSPPRSKRRGRGLAEVVAAMAAAEHSAPAPTSGTENRAHLSYNRKQPNRVEHARHLTPWARAVLDVGDFNAGHLEGWDT